MSVEPCGSLPVTHLSVSAHWCEHHLAWSCNFHVARQTTDEDLEIRHMEHLAFGPFDSWDDVVDWIMSRLEDPSLPPA